MTKNKILDLPFTKTGRKYGYITWRKKNDEKIKGLFDEAKSINILYGDNNYKNKSIDWDKRRIGITYSLTRAVSSKMDTIRISELNRGNFKLEFKD